MTYIVTVGFLLIFDSVKAENCSRPPSLLTWHWIASRCFWNAPNRCLSMRTFSPVSNLLLSGPPKWIGLSVISEIALSDSMENTRLRSSYCIHFLIWEFFGVKLPTTLRCLTTWSVKCDLFIHENNIRLRFSDARKTTVHAYKKNCSICKIVCRILFPILTGNKATPRI